MKIAILDLYNGVQNTGMSAIKEIINAHHPSHQLGIFDTRQKNEWPNSSEWDVIISTGGPGDPANGYSWAEKYKHFIQAIVLHNQKENTTPIPIFLICFSFQLFCHHFELGVASQREEPAFGAYNCSLTPYGKKNILMGTLTDHFQVADFRSYQITQPHALNIKNIGATILALEKVRPNIDKDQALMAIQFSPHIYGTQFHPEASGDKVRETFLQHKDKLQSFLGNKHYEKAVKKLEDVTGINKTHATILPRFLDLCQSIINKDDLKK